LSGSGDPVRRRRVHHLGLLRPGRRLSEVCRRLQAEPHRNLVVRIPVPSRLAGEECPMTRLIVRRLAVSIVILIIVSRLVFLATLVLPGDPARAILGQQATPERLAALREQMHLNDPIWQRYLSWLGGLFVGNF